jgi:hypothetical protein
MPPAEPIAFQRSSSSTTRSRYETTFGSSKIRAAVSNAIPCFRRLMRFFLSSHAKICIYRIVAHRAARFGSAGPAVPICVSADNTSGGQRSRLPNDKSSILAAKRAEIKARRPVSSAKSFKPGEALSDRPSSGPLERCISPNLTDHGRRWSVLPDGSEPALGSAKMPLCPDTLDFSRSY